MFPDMTISFRVIARRPRDGPKEDSSRGNRSTDDRWAQPFPRTRRRPTRQPHYNAELMCVKSGWAIENGPNLEAKVHPAETLRWELASRKFVRGLILLWELTADSAGSWANRN